MGRQQPMREAFAWLQSIADARAAQTPIWTGRGVTVLRVTGGANNALNRVEVAGQRFACKLCVDDGRQRGRREYGALRLLQSLGLDTSPEPLWPDESCAVVPYPAVAYRWLPGKPLGSELTGAKLTAPKLAALIESIQRVHSVRPGDVAGVELPDAWFHWFDFGPYLDELRGFLAEYGRWLIDADRQGRELCERLDRLVDDCAEFVAMSHADPRRARIPLRLCRVDPNLANAVWCDDARLRRVDWESSGWGDPALDLADLRWHAALDGLSSAEHAVLRNSYRRPKGDGSFEERLAVWDRLLATRWALLILRLLWSAHEGPDRERLTQPAGDAAALRAQLARFIERAEHAAVEAR